MDARKQLPETVGDQRLGARAHHGLVLPRQIARRCPEESHVCEFENLIVFVGVVKPVAEDDIQQSEQTSRVYDRTGGLLTGKKMHRRGSA